MKNLFLLFLSLIWFFIIYLMGLAYFSWGLEITSPNLYFFIIEFLFLGLIISLITLLPLFLVVFRAYGKKFLVIPALILIGSSLFLIRSTGISYFFPIPIYPGASNVKYSYHNSGTGEGDMNEMSLSFSFPATRKSAVDFYQEKFLERNWTISCQRQIEMCPIYTGWNGGQFDLIFNASGLSFYLFSKSQE